MELPGASMRQLTWTYRHARCNQDVHLVFLSEAGGRAKKVEKASGATIIWTIMLRSRSARFFHFLRSASGLAQQVGFLGLADRAVRHGAPVGRLHAAVDMGGHIALTRTYLDPTGRPD